MPLPNLQVIEEGHFCPPKDGNMEFHTASSRKEELFLLWLKHGIDPLTLGYTKPLPSPSGKGEWRWVWQWVEEGGRGLTFNVRILVDKILGKI